MKTLSCQACKFPLNIFLKQSRKWYFFLKIVIIRQSKKRLLTSCRKNYDNFHLGTTIHNCSFQNFWYNSAARPLSVYYLPLNVALSWSTSNFLAKPCDPALTRFMLRQSALMIANHPKRMTQEEDDKTYGLLFIFTTVFSPNVRSLAIAH